MTTPAKASIDATTRSAGAARTGTGLKKPRALRRGDRVALVAPTATNDAAGIAKGAEILRSFGLVVEEGGGGPPHRYLAADDEVRAAALHEAFEDPGIAAIVATRGGYGSARLLGHFDAAAIAAHPKVFVGYSDLSVLLSRLVQEAGMVCFHGPVACGDLAAMTPPQLERFRRFLFGEPGWWAGAGLEGRVPGTARGRLAGGCLSVLVTTLGTPYEIDTHGAVLFLEDIAEKPFRIDRMLTHLAHAGKFDDVAAVVLGSFERCDDAASPGLLREVFDEILGGLGVPVLAGLDAGHGSGHAVLPMGCEVEVDADRGVLELTEPALDEDAPAAPS